MLQIKNLAYASDVQETIFSIKKKFKVPKNYQFLKEFLISVFENGFVKHISQIFVFSCFFNDLEKSSYFVLWLSSNYFIFFLFYSKICICNILNYAYIFFNFCFIFAVKTQFLIFTSDYRDFYKNFP